MPLSPLAQDQAERMETGIHLWKQLREVMLKPPEDTECGEKLRVLNEKLASMPEDLRILSLKHEELEYLEAWIKQQMPLTSFSLGVLGGPQYTDPTRVPRRSIARCLTLNGERYLFRAEQEAWVVLALIYKCGALTWKPVGWEDYSSLAFSLAKIQIHRKPWYRGVCTNSLQDCYEEGDSVTSAAEYIANETYGIDGDWWKNLSTPENMENS